ncbi:MAG: transcription antitermination factor NusB [Spirochaetales bacterium]|nr:transcription antitermination factor NusB [Spirochaetales bacterium]
MKKRRQSRIIALQSLYSYEISRPNLDSLLTFEWLDEGEGAKDKDLLFFASILIRGTVENLSEIDSIIVQQLDHWSLDRIPKVDLSILRLATYELMFHEEIPGRVTFNEAVELAKEFGTDESYKFVNGVLDGISKKFKNEKRTKL